jgi:hypothetical protein
VIVPSRTRLSNSNRLDRDRELREDYRNLLSVNPKLLDVLSHKSTSDAAKALTSGRDAFRNTENHRIIKEIPLWPTGYNIPGAKAMRGINDDVCGGLLCPPQHDWNDPR